MELGAFSGTDFKDLPEQKPGKISFTDETISLIHDNIDCLF